MARFRGFEAATGIMYVWLQIHTKLNLPLMQWLQWGMTFSQVVATIASSRSVHLSQAL